MKTAAIIIVGILIFGSAATYYRYESFSPCIWMEKDLSKQTGLPTIVVQGQVKAKFLLDGVVNPTRTQCLRMWWKLKADGEISPKTNP
ncbi:MAG: hypothetical protein VW802_12730 [Rhodospirillaceae bacterium]|jgi:hypothetical protein